MLTSGDIVYLELGVPEGREAGFRHPAVLVTAQATLAESPGDVHVVPFTSILRNYHSEVEIIPDQQNGCNTISAARCQHPRAM